MIIATIITLLISAGIGILAYQKLYAKIEDFNKKHRINEAVHRNICHSIHQHHDLITELTKKIETNTKKKRK